MEEGAQSTDDCDIDRDDRQRQPAVDERPVDQEIDVVEAVAQDRDADRQGQAEDAGKNRRRSRASSEAIDTSAPATNVDTAKQPA